MVTSVHGCSNRCLRVSSAYTPWTFDVPWSETEEWLQDSGFVSDSQVGLRRSLGLYLCDVDHNESSSSRQGAVRSLQIPVARRKNDVNSDKKEHQHAQAGSSAEYCSCCHLKAQQGIIDKKESTHSARFLSNMQIWQDLPASRQVIVVCRWMLPAGTILISQSYKHHACWFQDINSYWNSHHRFIYSVFRMHEVPPATLTEAHDSPAHAIRSGMNCFYGSHLDDIRRHKDTWCSSLRPYAEVCWFPISNSSYIFVLFQWQSTTNLRWMNSLHTPLFMICISQGLVCNPPVSSHDRNQE